MAYLKQEVLNGLNLITNQMSTFYKQSVINNRGQAADSGEKYTEIISEYLLNNFLLFGQINPITRQRAYRVPTHNGTTTLAASNRIEERIALSMYGKTYPEIGKIIDYQVPIKNVQSDEAGKIDLLSLYQGELWILELKRPDNNETLLRCVLEAATYGRTIDQDKLAKEWNKDATMPVRTAILVFSDGAQHKEYVSSVNPRTIDLMKALGVEIFLIQEIDETGTYTVRKP